LSSESKAEDIKADAIQSFKTEREEKTRDAEIRAQAEYNKIVNDGNDLAQQLKARVSDKGASAVDFVINNIIK
jgi:vacuolar-type H+-ATPase subunit H